jgi:hypothetical protein
MSTSRTSMLSSVSAPCPGNLHVTAPQRQAEACRTVLLGGRWNRSCWGARKGFDSQRSGERRLWQNRLDYSKVVTERAAPALIARLNTCKCTRREIAGTLALCWSSTQGHPPPCSSCLEKRQQLRVIKVAAKRSPHGKDLMDRIMYMASISKRAALKIPV